MSTAYPIQQRFLSKIRSLVSANYSLVDQLVELLGLSQDSVYRRLRGETALTLDEVYKICEYYQISLDILQEKTVGSVTLHYQTLKNEADFEQYLQNLLGTLQKGLQTDFEKKIIYIADDIPIFHLFFKPEYAAFNLFYWLKSVLQADSLLGKKFAPEYVKPEWVALAQEIYRAYCQIPSVEVWTEESLNSTLNQILYYWESGLFEDRSYAVLIIEQTLEVLRTIQEQAELSSKLRNKRQSSELGESYLLYVSELQIGNNCVLATIGEQQIVYVRHQTFNVLQTANPMFYRETESWVQNEIRKSSLISGVSEKQRYQFFQTLIRKTEKVLEKIQG